MSKIICDVCGTAYPDTAAQCPICGSTRPQTATAGNEPAQPEQNPAPQPAAPVSKPTAPEPVPAQPEQESTPVPEAEMEEELGGYNYVRGGRFSKSNVKKRNKAAGVVPEPRRRAPAKREEPKQEEPDDEEPLYQEPEEGKKKGPGLTGILVIAAVGLLLAIVAMVVNIYLSFFRPANKPTQPSTGTVQTDPPTLPQPTDPTEAPTQAPTTPAGKACTGLKLSDSRITLDAVGRVWLLNVKTEPADTTDPVTFASSNDLVATVSQDGRVTAVSNGQAVITVTCGTHSVQCSVECNIPTEATEPEETTATEPDATEAPTEPEPTRPDSSEFSLDTTDATLFYKGENFRFSIGGGISPLQVSWYSADPSVATVSEGWVTAVGPGTTYVYGTYNGQTVRCIIRCVFEEETTAPTEAPTAPPTEKPTEPPTEQPTEPPTEQPTEPPTEAPTEAPTEEPTEPPTEAPTEAPTEEPTEPPTEEPTEPEGAVG